MWNSFFRAICRVGIFMICAQAIVHFRPKETYEKYLKLLVSVMILIQLFLPFGSFLLGKGGQETAQEMARFRAELEESMKAAEENAAAADEILEQMTLEEVRRRMEAQTESLQDEDTAEGSQDGQQSESAIDGQQEGSMWNSGRDESRQQDSAVEKIQVDVEEIDSISIGTSSQEGTGN